MGVEIEQTFSRCVKCGRSYEKYKSNFSACYAKQYKGVGRLPVCKECVDEMYSRYLSQCNDAKVAVRQMCRKLDLYWSEAAYEYVQKKATKRSVITDYIVRLNTNSYAGKSYDDTLLEEGTLWLFGDELIKSTSREQDDSDAEDTYPELDNDIVIDDSVLLFWGPGYSTSKYIELERRRKYWMSGYPEDVSIDIGTEALIRQICNVELDINTCRSKGVSVDKLVNTLNSLLGSLNVKPAQLNQSQSSGAESQFEKPMGVWAQIYENDRPISEPDPEFKDVDGIVKYISTWFLGHLCKMLNIKNTYCKLYEDAIVELRVNHPEFDEEEDEAMFSDIFGYTGGDASE